MAGHKANKDPVANAPVVDYRHSGRAFPNRELHPTLRKHAKKISEVAKDHGLTHHPVKFLQVTPKE